MSTLSSRAPQVVIIMATCSVPDDDKGGAMSSLGFQYMDTPKTWPMFFGIPRYYLNLFSDIFHHHSEPFVKMWNEAIFHSCHQTKLRGLWAIDFRKDCSL